MRFVYKHKTEDLWFVAELPEPKSGELFDWWIGSYVVEPHKWDIAVGSPFIETKKEVSE